MNYIYKCLDEVRVSELFFEKYCMNCPKLERIPATRIDPEETTCEVGLDFTDPGCIEHKTWEALQNQLESLFEEFFDN